MELRGAARHGKSRGGGSASFLALQSIPPALRPLVRAYLLGYLSAVAPRLLTLVLQHVSNRKRKTPKYALPERDEYSFVDSVGHVLRTGLDPRRFPTFCAALVGGSTLLQVIMAATTPPSAPSLFPASPFRVQKQHQYP